MKGDIMESGFDGMQAIGTLAIVVWTFLAGVVVGGLVARKDLKRRREGRGEGEVEVEIEEEKKDRVPILEKRLYVRPTTPRPAAPSAYRPRVGVRGE